MAHAEHGVAYRRSGDGPTVVLVHGIPGQGHGWSSVEAALARSFDVITVDLRGFGASSGSVRPVMSDVGPAAQADALRALLDELQVGTTTLVGHDFGAPVAVLLTDARPDLVGALVLLAGNTFPDTPVPFPLSLTTVPVLGQLVSRLLFSRAALAFMLRRGVGAGSKPPDPAVYLGDDRQQRTIATIFYNALTRLEELYGPVADALERINVPVLVGWGDQDPFFPVAQGARTATAVRGRLHIFEGAGHFLPHERPDEVARVVADFAAASTK
jgi:pimeloyl-ACP methyl ester carboxylesterase